VLSATAVMPQRALAVREGPRRVDAALHLAVETLKPVHEALHRFGILPAEAHPAVLHPLARYRLAGARIAYTLLSLFRSVSLRSDEGRATRWKALLQSVRDLLTAATEDQFAGLRQREAAAATR
jgi:hypothetical protein